MVRARLAYMILEYTEIAKKGGSPEAKEADKTEREKAVLLLQTADSLRRSRIRGDCKPDPTKSSKLLPRSSFPARSC